MSCGGGGFTPDGAYDSVWDSVRPMTGKFSINYFQYQVDVGCVCMLNDWISSNDVLAQTTTSFASSTKRIFGASACSTTGSAATLKFGPTITTSPVQLKGKGRSEMWEVYLYGDKMIKVERDSWKS